MLQLLQSLCSAAKQGPHAHLQRCSKGPYGRNRILFRSRTPSKQSVTPGSLKQHGPTNHRGGRSSHPGLVGKLSSAVAKRSRNPPLKIRARRKPGRLVTLRIQSSPLENIGKLPSPRPKCIQRTTHSSAPGSQKNRFRYAHHLSSYVISPTSNPQTPFIHSIDPTHPQYRPNSPTTPPSEKPYIPIPLSVVRGARKAEAIHAYPWIVPGSFEDRDTWWPRDSRVTRGNDLSYFKLD